LGDLRRSQDGVTHALVAMGSKRQGMPSSAALKKARQQAAQGICLRIAS
jgi:hypothetical protein